MSTLKYEWRKYLKEMRTEGFAVVFVTPEILNGTDPDEVEKLMLQSAYEFVDGSSKEGFTEHEINYFSKAEIYLIVKALRYATEYGYENTQCQEEVDEYTDMKAIIAYLDGRDTNG